MIDYYKMLGISPQASPEAIRSAFRGQAKRYHPDMNPTLPGPRRERAQRRFIQLAQAYEILIDPARREDYDRQWRAAHPHRPGPKSRGAGGTGSRGGSAADMSRPARGSGGRGEGAAGSAEGARRATENPDSPHLDDLLREVDDLLGGVGLDLKQPMERILEELLNWARRIFEEMLEALLAAERARKRRRPRRPPDPVGRDRPPPSGPAHDAREREARRTRASTTRASGTAVERELSDIKRRVRSGIRARGPSVEEELRMLKARRGESHNGSRQP